MNKLALTILCILIFFLFSASLSSSSQQTAAELFERALYMEEGRGDLLKAIELYQKILKQFPANREYSAAAQLHIAFCNEKLGIKDFLRTYQHVIDNFPEQTETAKIAQNRLIRFSQALEKTKPRLKQYIFQYAEPIWTGPDVSLLASPSPDSQALSYIDPYGCVVIRELTTRKSSKLTNEGFSSPSSEFPLVTRWSSDGKQIVFNRYSKDSIFELWIIGLNSTKPRLLRQNKSELYIRPYDWSYDGKSILATITRADNTNLIVLISSTDGSVKILKKLDKHFPKNMSFSPDGRFIVYDCPTAETSDNRDLFLLPTGGGNETVLLQRQANDMYPFWISDGKRILFLSDQAQPLSVLCLHVKDGRKERNPYPLRVNFGDIVPLGFTHTGAFFFGFSSGESEGTFSGEITRIENYFPVIPPPDYSEPKLIDVMQIESPDPEHGTGIAVFENKIYLSGWREVEKGQGILVKYSIVSDKSPPMDWILSWPNQFNQNIEHINSVLDISISEEGTYLAGYGTSFAHDDTGSLEGKAYLLKFPHHNTEMKPEIFSWLQSPNYFQYEGREGFETILTSTEKSQIYIYAAGSGQANWANNTAVLSKFDSRGQQLWWKTLGDSRPQKGSTCRDIIKHQNSLYIAGFIQDNLTDFNSRTSALWKYNLDGNLQWKTKDNKAATAGWGITALGDHVFVTGGGEQANHGIIIQKFDTDGSLLWETSVKGPSIEIGFDIASENNVLYITGMTESLGPGHSDVFLLEVDPDNGTILSFNVWGGPEDDSAKGIAVNGRDIYIAGETTNTETGDTDIVLLWFKK